MLSTIDQQHRRIASLVSYAFERDSSHPGKPTTAQTERFLEVLVHQFTLTEFTQTVANLYFLASSAKNQLLLVASGESVVDILGQLPGTSIRHLRPDALRPYRRWLWRQLRTSRSHRSLPVPERQANRSGRMRRCAGCTRIAGSSATSHQSGFYPSCYQLNEFFVSHGRGYYSGCQRMASLIITEWRLSVFAPLKACCKNEGILDVDRLSTKLGKAPSTDQGVQT